MVSIFSLTLLAFNRFLIISSDLPPHRRYGKGSNGVSSKGRQNSNKNCSFILHVQGNSTRLLQTMAALAIVWTLALLTSLPPTIGWGKFVPDRSGLRYVLTVCRRSSILHKSPHFRTYVRVTCYFTNLYSILMLLLSSCSPAAAVLIGCQRPLYRTPSSSSH